MKPHVGKKILYTTVIILSALVILLSAAGIIGVWIVKRPLSDTTVALFSVVEKSSKVIRSSTGQVDQVLGVLETQTTKIAEATDQLSQSVTDKGLALVLLPEEQEAQLVETAGTLRDTYQGIQDTLANGLELYRSINSIPFINLPGLSQDKLSTIENTLLDIQEVVRTLRSEILKFRSGVTDSIDLLTETTKELESDLKNLRTELARLDTNLATLEDLSVRLQDMIPGAILAISMILTLILAFLIFAQVEVIRLYLNRWQLLAQPQEVSAEENETDQ